MTGQPATRVIASRCLNESATPVRLEIVQITSPKGCRTYGRSVFAPVGRGTPGHPDRGRQRRQHTRDRRDAGPQPVQHQPGDQAQHMVPVQRERVVPPVPAEKTEGGAMDRPLLHRRARAAQGRPQEIQATKALPAVARPPVGAGGRMAVFSQVGVSCSRW